MSWIEPTPTTRRRPRAASAAPGPAASFVRWLIGLLVWIAGVVMLTVIVIGAFWAHTGIGVGALACALVVAYFMTRDPQS